MNKTFYEIGSSYSGIWGKDLLRKGWCGYFIDPNPVHLAYLYQELRAEFGLGAWHTICAAINHTEKMEEFLTANLTGTRIWGSLKESGIPNMAEFLKYEGHQKETIWTPTLHLKTLSELTQCPNAILITTMGSEFEILRNGIPIYSDIWAFHTDTIPEKMEVLENNFHASGYILYQKETDTNNITQYIYKHQDTAWDISQYVVYVEGGGYFESGNIKLEVVHE